MTPTGPVGGLHDAEARAEGTSDAPAGAQRRRSWPERAGCRAVSTLLDILALAAAPAIAVGLGLFGRKGTWSKVRGGLGGKLGQGLAPRTTDKPLLWIHAVSVGEVLTALPLVDALRARWPDWELRVSVATHTGMETARARLPEGVAIWAPVELSWVLGKFFRRLRPAAVVLMELELWPNFLLTARRLGVPVLVANGRITERSARRYARLGPAARALFGCVDSYGAQSAACRDRFLRLGVEPARVELLGNLKHDQRPSPKAAKAPETRAWLGWAPQATAVIVAGSTHPGEERALCALHARLSAHRPELRLVLAPRHVERLSDAEIESWAAARPIVRWSSIRDAKAPLPAGGILLVDTVGELELFYALGDLVFVGGSLVPHGGHNVFEPARLARPILLGPHYQNFREEVEALTKGGGAFVAADAPALEAEAARLLDDGGERTNMGRKALEVSQRLGGAVDRHIEWLGRRLRLYLPSGAG